MSGVAIEANRLTKTFREGVVAVKDLDMEVRRGAVYGLLGRNGSGKTTTLRLLLGLLRPDRGQARLLGWDLWRAPRALPPRTAPLRWPARRCRCISEERGWLFSPRPDSRSESPTPASASP